MPKADPVGERESGAFAYVCGHGASNSPCPEHHPGYPELDESWVDDPSPEGTPSGLTDKFGNLPAGLIGVSPDELVE